MFRNRMAYAILLVAAGMLMYYTADSSASLLLYSLLLLPVMSLLLLLVSLLFLRADSKLTENQIEKDGEVSVEVSLRNRGPLYIPFLNLHFTQNAIAFHPSFRVEPVALAPAARVKRTATACCRYAGRFNVGLSRVWVSDLCGLFSLPIGFKPETLYVCPAVTPIEIPPGLIGMVEREATLSRREQKGDGTEFHSIRKYREGDLLKRVHWGISAKTGELQVRQLLRTPDPTCTVLLDPKLTGKPDALSVPLTDGLLCCAISLAAAFTEAKIPVRLLYWDGMVRSEQLFSDSDIVRGRVCLSHANFSDSFTLDDLISDDPMHLKTGCGAIVVMPDRDGDLGKELCELGRSGSGVVVCLVAMSGQALGNVGDALQKLGITVCRYVADTGELMIVSTGGGERT